MNALAIGLVLSLLPAADPVREAKPGEVLKRATESRVVRFLQDDRLTDAAREAQQEVGGQFLITAAEKAEADGKTADALCCYEAYIRHFPLCGFVEWNHGVSPHWPGQPGEWRRGTAGYLTLLAKTERPTADWFTQSRDALKLYERILEAFAERDAKTYLPLVDEIVTKYPKSLYVQPAVVTAFIGRRIVGHSGEGFANPVGLLDEYLKAMTKAGVPKEDRLLVLLVREEQRRREASSKETRYEPTAEFTEACKTARSQPVRHMCLLNQLRDHLRAKDTKNVRATVEAYLAAESESARDSARMKVVSVFYELATFDANRPDDLLVLVRAWQKEKVAFPETATLQAAAGLYAKANDRKRADDLYREAVRAAKSDAEAARIKFDLAMMYTAAKDDKNRLPVLADLAAIATDPKGDGGDRPIRHAAREMLADHHYGRKEWKDALAIYEVWDPQVGCGLGAVEGVRKKTDRIAECRKQLDK